MSGFAYLVGNKVDGATEASRENSNGTVRPDVAFLSSSTWKPGGGRFL